MADFDWHDCRFLESTDNLKPLIKIRVGKAPNQDTAREIVACLQQGRLFYQAAALSPLEIKPLQLFYGMVGFAKALIVARRLKRLSTLCHAHGVSDISTQNSRISELKVKIERAGTFQVFNDVVSDLTRFCYFESTQHRAISLPSAKSTCLADATLSLRDILSRVPGLEHLFRMTFGEQAQTAAILVHNIFPGAWRLRIDADELFCDRQSLQSIVNQWRARFPFMNKWLLKSAEHAWGKSLLLFENQERGGLDDLSEDYLREDVHAFNQNPKFVQTFGHFTLSEGLSPLGGGYSNGPAYAIAPVQSSCLSEFSLHYLGLFLLSSLVRYRPQTWMHAISGTVDDSALSLIERFLSLNMVAIPLLIVTALNPHEDQYP